MTYYLAHKEKWIEYGRTARAQPGYPESKRAKDGRRRERLRAAVDQIKLDSGCVDCGYKASPRALHFDHVRGKKIVEVSVMVTNRNSFEKILAEIEKCEVRCANCHAERTWRP